MSELQKAALNAVIASLLAAHAACDAIEASLAQRPHDDDETRDRDTEHQHRPRHRVH